MREIRVRGAGPRRSLLVGIPRPLELQRRGVDAVAEPRGLGPVLEDVAEVAVAGGAPHLGARHEEAPVGLRVHRAGVDRLPEAGPPGARIELGARREEGRAAAGARSAAADAPRGLGSDRAAAAFLRVLLIPASLLDPSLPSVKKVRA